jgi:hypothetical protein
VVSWCGVSGVGVRVVRMGEQKLLAAVCSMRPALVPLPMVGPFGTATPIPEREKAPSTHLWPHLPQ